MIAFAFDTFNSNREAYIININPYGNPKDFISSISGYTDYNWDIIIHTGTKIYKDCWTVEVAIPFNSLSFDESKENQEWGFYCLRKDRKNNETSIYPAWTRKIRNYFAQAGVLKGLKNIKSGKNLEFLPYLLSSYLDRENREHNYDIGINVNYNISSKLTLSTTFNPDYSQIEADPLNIDINQRNPFWLEEKRPFFSQGMDIFNTGMLDIVYTRNIVNPISGIKICGKYPDFSLGVVSALDKGINDNKNDLYNLLRIKKNILKESSVGLLATFNDDLNNYYSNRVFSIDAVLAFPHNYTLKWQSAYSQTKSKEEQSDSTYSEINKHALAHLISFERQSESMFSAIWMNSFPENFQLGSGYLRYDYIGRRELGLDNIFWFRNFKKSLNEIELDIGTNAKFDMKNELLEKYAWTDLEFDWKNNFWNEINLNLNHDHFKEKDFYSTELEINAHKRISGQFDYWFDSSTGSKPYYGDSELNWNNSFTGWHYYLETGINAKIFKRISISSKIAKEDFYFSFKAKRKYYSYNFRNKITWMIANKMHLRNITQGKYVKLNFKDEYGLDGTLNKTFSTSLLLSYEYSPLSNIYFGCNLNNISNYHNIFGDIQIFFKINYLGNL